MTPERIEQLVAQALAFDAVSDPRGQVEMTIRQAIKEASAVPEALAPSIEAIALKLEGMEEYTIARELRAAAALQSPPRRTDDPADPKSLLPGLQCARLTILNAEDTPIQPYAIQIIDRLIQQCGPQQP